MIEAKNVTIKYGRFTALENVSMNAGNGEIALIIGGSGCGKSTLLRAIMGLIPISGGEIHIEGSRADNLNERRFNELRKKMGMVFQEGALFDSMNVFENVAFALRQHSRMKEKQIREIVLDRLEAVELEGVEKKMPSELSGGMRRRVGIARALANHPSMLLYDEPTTGLDPVLTSKVTDLIMKMRDRYGATSIIVTHDMGVAEKTGGKIYMIGDHRVVAEGSIGDLRKSNIPQVREFMTAMNATGGEARE